MPEAAFFPQEIIRRKRDGAALTGDEIAFLVRGLADGTITEGQVAAFAMAVYFQGMAGPECAALTRAMTASGVTLDWREIDRPVVDKHSTGGVGDKVSLVLAPIVAACGAAVPMISGRGLGHTGGTLDKLESIPGYGAVPGLARFKAVVADVGCAIIGQTDELAPADRRLYAIRDVTATVESVPLITASILSKKLAAGLGSLVMDVKVGSGAFMTGIEEARALADSIVEVAAQAGLPTTALITDMNQVLGRTAGNALEVAECLDFLTGAPAELRLREVVVALAAEMLGLAGLAGGEVEARDRVETVLSSGAAAERFARMVAALGGPADLLERSGAYLPAAETVLPVAPDRPGRVAALDTRAVGLAVMALGGGRRRAEDAVDPAVGLSEVAGPGEAVGPDRPLALVHARDRDAALAAAAALKRAVTIGDGGPPPGSLIHARVAGPA